MDIKNLGGGKLFIFVLVTIVFLLYCIFILSTFFIKTSIDNEFYTDLLKDRNRIQTLLDNPVLKGEEDPTFVPLDSLSGTASIDTPYYYNGENIIRNEVLAEEFKLRTGYDVMIAIDDIVVATTLKTSSGNYLYGLTDLPQNQIRSQLRIGGKKYYINSFQFGEAEFYYLKERDFDLFSREFLTFSIVLIGLITFYVSNRIYILLMDLKNESDVLITRTSQKQEEKHE